jgi:uncharacterized membrane protein YcaP (DUF421 family)
MFVPSEPVLETIIRGSAVYLALFFMLRLFRRQTGSISPADLLVLLLIADAAQNAMADGYKSVTDGVILVGVIIAWECIVDWLAYHSPRWRSVLQREPLVLIDHGLIDHQHLRGELMTLDDLLAQLRQKGIDDPSLVKLSCLEGDGHISVILRNPSSVQDRDDQPSIE